MLSSQEELQRLKSQTEIAKAESTACQEKFLNLQSKLSEETERRQKVEKCLEMHKKLSSGLNSKLQGSEAREQHLKAGLAAKESELATLKNSLPQENQTLKDDVRRLSLLMATKKSGCKMETTDKDTVRKSVDDAMRKATAKFSRFHKDEIKRFELQLQSSEEVIRSLEAQLDAAAEQEDAELTKLRTLCSRMELDVSASKSREDLQV